MLLAYFDARPFLYLAGVPVALLLAWLAWALLGLRLRRGGLLAWLLSGFVAYTLLFALLLAGPFVGRESLETFEMTWSVAQAAPAVSAPDEVTLTFVAHPDHQLIQRSDPLAEHLALGGREVVSATFRVTRDYGRMRGFRMVEVDGLRDFASSGSTYRIQGGGEDGPW